MELLELKSDSQLHDAAGSQIPPLHYAAARQISPLHFAWCSRESNFSTAFCSRESNLTAVWCSGESNLTAAWCSRESIWKRGVKSKNFRRLPGPLKGQSCKKYHIWGTFTIQVLRALCIKALPAYYFLDSLLHDAAGSQTSNSNNSLKLKPKAKIL